MEEGEKMSSKKNGINQSWTTEETQVHGLFKIIEEESMKILLRKKSKTWDLSIGANLQMENRP